MRTFTPQILRFETLPSTNLEAARRAIDGAPEGLCVVAAEQTAGRGRLQREWVSPRGAGLYFSIILRPAFDQTRWPLLTLMAAVAVSEALLESCALETDIKWPNDVMANDKKLCGILAETVETPTGRAVVVGIGINLTDHAFQDELNTVATSVEAVTGEKPDLEAVLAALVSSIAKYLQMLQAIGGPDGVVQEWSRRSSYASGKRIRIANGDEILEGTARGLERDGALRVETAEGDIRIVRAGDVSSLRPVPKQ